MGSIHLTSLSDYDKHGFDLEVFCRTCGHKKVIVPGELFAKGILGTVQAIEKRLRCTRCKGRNGIITPTSSGPSGGRRRDGWR